jgi:hypothetical protein
VKSVVHALGRVHRALTDHGMMLDLHPLPPHAHVFSAGKKLGNVDDVPFAKMVRDAETELERSKLFVLEEEMVFEVRERFDSALALLEAIPRRKGWKGSRELIEQISTAVPPFLIEERAVLRRFRVVR